MGGEKKQKRETSKINIPPVVIPMRTGELTGKIDKYKEQMAGDNNEISLAFSPR